jgi:VWFA-related protein
MANKIIWIVVISLLLIFPLCTQEKEEPLREKVETVNIEVPVRVYASGIPVTNLKKEDFILYDGGKVKAINGFFLSTKKIARPAAAVEAPAEPIKTSPARYFVLVFRVYDFNKQLRDGLAHVFEKILRADDQLLVFINNKTMVYNQLQEKEKVHADTEQALREQCHIAKNIMISNLKVYEDEANQTALNLRGFGQGLTSTPSQVAKFLERFLVLWQDYKRNFLTQDVDSYYNFAKHLAGIKKEKWVINFYQLEMFPRMILDKGVRQVIQNCIEGYRASDSGEDHVASTTLSRALSEIDKEMSVSVDFPVDEISKLFYKANATFHSVFIRSQMETYSNNFEFKPIATSIENSLRDLTMKTGGTLIASNDIVSSMDTIAEIEDNVYMLTYSPTNPKKIGKIKVQIANGKYDVFYDNNMRADYINDHLNRIEMANPAIKFQELSFAAKKLSLALTNFKMQNAGGKTSGKLSIRIQIKSPSGEMVFNRSRSFETVKDPVSLSLDFNFLNAGKYDVIVDVQDLLSGKACTDFLQPIVE